MKGIRAPQNSHRAVAPTAGPEVSLQGQSVFIEVRVRVRVRVRSSAPMSRAGFRTMDTRGYPFL